MNSNNGIADRGFIVSVYSRVYETRKMADPAWLNACWENIASNVKVDKIYLETHRDTIIAESDLLERLKAFYAERGVQTAGGITYTIDESNRFETYCYTRPVQRKMVQEIIEHTARHFDEIILDDFFFTSCKCESCIQAKGSRSWSSFRVELMRAAAQDLILGPARAVNPNVKVIIKYPNWYEHFQGLGFDLEQEPALFDGIYTGTETRQPFYNHQHLQQYHGYSIVRYFENLAPGRNGGGWVDTGGMSDVDRYAEQIWLTLFARAPEITLFDFKQLQDPILPGHRPAWQGTYDFEGMAAPFVLPDGKFGPELTVARAAGVTIERVEPLIRQLGIPVGVPSYKPCHSTGEDFLHSYIGMIGIPMDLRPTFPEDARTIFLTENAAFDPEIASKIESFVRGGGSAVITSGLLKALNGKGIEQIAEIVCTNKKVLTSEFYRWSSIYRSAAPILLPQIEYLTNDTWELIGADANGYPLVLQGDYGKGKLNVLAIPDNFADLYRLPVEVLNFLRHLIAGGVPVVLEGPAQICLFVYDNSTFVVESFLPEATEVRVVVKGGAKALCDLDTDEAIPGEPQGGDTVFTLPLKAHSFRPLAIRL